MQRQVLARGKYSMSEGSTDLGLGDLSSYLSAPVKKAATPAPAPVAPEVPPAPAPVPAPAPPAEPIAQAATEAVKPPPAAEVLEAAKEATAAVQSAAQSAVQAAPDAAANAGTAAQEAGAAVQAAGASAPSESLAEAAARLRALDTYSQIVQSQRGGGKAVTKAAEAAAGGAQDGAAALTDGASRAASDAAAAAGQAVQGLSSSLSDVTSGVTSGVTGALGGVTDAVGGVTSGVGAAAGQVAGQVGASVSSALSRVTQGLGAASSSAGSALDTVSQTAGQATSAVTGSLAAGQAAVQQTLAQGQAAVQDVLSSAQAAVEGTAASTTAAVGAASQQVLDSLPGPARGALVLTGKAAAAVGQQALAHPVAAAAVAAAVAVPSGISAYQRRYGGYAGELAPEQAFDLLMGDAPALLVDLRSAEERQQSGIAELKLAARSKVVAFPPMVNLVPAGIARAASNPAELNTLTNAAYLAGLKEVSGVNTRLILMDRGCSDKTRELARALVSIGQPLTYTMSGGFKGWQAAGLPVTSGPNYDTSPVALVGDNVEVLLGSAGEVAKDLVQPSKGVPLALATAAGAVALANYHTTLKYIALLGIGTSIARKVAEYDSPMDALRAAGDSVSDLAGTVTGAASKAAALLPKNGAASQLPPPPADSNDRVSVAAGRPKVTDSDGGSSGSDELAA